VGDEDEDDGQGKPEYIQAPEGAGELVPMKAAAAPPPQNDAGDGGDDGKRRQKPAISNPGGSYDGLPQVTDAMIPGTEVQGGDSIMRAEFSTGPRPGRRPCATGGRMLLARRGMALTDWPFCGSGRGV
jgi:hypothetical protein